MKGGGGGGDLLHSGGGGTAVLCLVCPWVIGACLASWAMQLATTAQVRINHPIQLTPGSHSTWQSRG